MLHAVILAAVVAAANPTAVVAPGVGYADVIRLEHQADPAANGRLLLTFEARGAGGVPVWEADARAEAWRPLGTVADGDKAGEAYRLRWQPNLLEVPRPSGGLKPGDVLLSANAVRIEAGGVVGGQHIRLYVSHDAGRTWSYLSEIVSGSGRPDDKDNRGVWEPNLRVLPDGRLVAYYSSEQHKDEGFNQLLAHKVSADGGRSWGPEKVDVAMPGEVERPGMTVVTAMPDGRYALSYEDIDGPDNGKVFLKFSRDGLDFGDPADRGTPVTTLSGAWPAASPIVTWVPTGRPNGALVVVAERGGGGGDPGGRSVYWNDDLGRGPWWRAKAPVAKHTGNIHAGWTQALLPTAGGFLHVTSSSDPAAPEEPDRNTILAATAPIPFRRYEAEDAERRGAVFIPTERASNYGRVRLSNLPGARLRFPLLSERDGPARLVVRYADVDHPTVLQVSVGGEAAAAPVPAPEIAGWRTVSTPIRLRKGVNEVVLGAGDHAVDVDYVELEPAS